ncbi:hypothetical protein CASFOL_013203 [Castilleja foliolosa]|uniref:F-box domain-containing protein n=1 Tax=Castilleja foliolosa TaxID=1961234 RepID=A0ABD3DJC0_9LAMI
MANSVLPEELMLCILTRLPVKTILRFKSVCKPWFHLFSTPEFKKLHQAQFSFSSDPKNQSFIFQSFDMFSIFNSESGKKRPTILDHPFDHAQNIELYTVGCCSGLVCIRRDQEIVLWNPALKLSKTVPLKDCEPLKMVSLGFGYDAIGDDFKVVMIVANFAYGVGMNITSVEIYSVNLGSWITIDVGFRFRLFAIKNDLIVNGNPYWVARVNGNDVLVCLDVSELVLKIVPWPTNYWMSLDEVAGADVDMVDLFVFEEETEIKTCTETVVALVDWNGAVGALIINYEVEYCGGPFAPFTECSVRIECVRVWVFDDIERIWRNDHTFWPIKMDVGRVIHCSKNGKSWALCHLAHCFCWILRLDVLRNCLMKLVLAARLRFMDIPRVWHTLMGWKRWL